MFERFTDRARRAVVFAQEEARTLNHNFIGTEHLLLGLLTEGEGIAARALRDLGADVTTLRAAILDQIGEGTETPKSHIPFTPRAKKTMEFSLQEALLLGHNYIGTEHLLLGLLREGEGVASQVLVRVGIGLSDARSKVIELLAGYKGKAGTPADAPPPTSAPAPPSSARESRHSPALRAALAQATALAGDGLVGTHHVLAALSTMDDAAAPQILEAGGFDSGALDTPAVEWDVRGTGDEDPIARATRGTVVIQDDSGLTVKLEDDALRQRIQRAIAAGNVDEAALREALGKVWADFAGGAEPEPPAPA